MYFDDFGKPVARWHIGNTTPDGYDCLVRSIEGFTSYYDVEVAICYNCPRENLPDRVARFRLIDQHKHRVDCPAKPRGVAWKLYPPRIAPGRHEIVIDNDIVFNRSVPEIDDFFQSDCTLLLAEATRTYGRFDKYVPPGFCINSGIYGMPPGFDLQRFMDLYVTEDWEDNAVGKHKENMTFDEQGLVAFALLSYGRSVIIPSDSVITCEQHLTPGNAYHFIGLNRRRFHRVYRLYKWGLIKSHL